MSAVAPTRPDPVTAVTTRDITRRLELATARDDITERQQILNGLRTAGLRALAAELAAVVPAGGQAGR